MTTKFRPRLDSLPQAQQTLWPELHRATELGFVLYGGTAIALRLGHRQSVDFDFFSDKPLIKDVVMAAFSFAARSTVLQDERDSLSLLVPYSKAGGEYVKVSFFGGIGFGRINDPELTQDGVLQVASLDDLMATKLKVILQRAEAKDYRDITAMIAAGVSLAKGLAVARAFYGTQFQPNESLKALVYFEDGDLDTLTPVEKNILVKAASSVYNLPEATLLSKNLSPN